MKSKSLVQIDSVIGIAGGIILILGFWIIAVVGASAGGSKELMSVLTQIVNWLKVVVLVLGVVTIVAYHGSKLVSVIPSLFFILGGAIALLPFLWWAGGILTVIGGGLYISNLKQICISFFCHLPFIIIYIAFKTF